MADRDAVGSPLIRLRVLGGLDIQAADGTEFRALLVQPKRVALLAHLAIAKPRSFHRRDTLLALFWPDLDDSHARGALSQALTYLRHALGSDVLLNRGPDEIGLDAERFWCDAVAFEERIAAGDEAEALAIYQGELLDGVFLSEAPPFERWLDAERRRLHELARAAALRLATSCEVNGDVGAALRWARRARALAPYDEPALRRVVELLDRSGDRVGAVREYDAFKTELREELEVEVEASPETTAVVEAVRARATTNEFPRPGRAAPLVTAALTAPVSKADVARAPRRHWIPGGVRTTAAVVLLLVIGGGATIAARANLIARRAAALTPRRIVVIPFENQTGDPALEPVGRIAADWILQGLARTEVVDVVPSVEVSERLKELQQGSSENAATRTRALARALAAGTAVVGSYHRRDDDLEFQVQVIDIGRGRLVRAIDGVRGRQNDPMAAIDDLRRKTLGAIAFRFDARIPQGLYSDIRPPTYEAYQAFAVGEDLRNRWEWRRALTYFRKAYALDTTFTTALFLAVIQHVNLREYAEADSLIRLLTGSRERLPALERQLLEWAEAKVSGDLQGALDAARGLVPFGEGFRGTVGLEALYANRPRETVEPQNVDLPHLLERRSSMWNLAYGRRMTEAYHRLGDYGRELAEAKQARKRTPEVVEPVLWEMRALTALGRVEHARERLGEALAMQPDREWPAGEIMVRAADELRAHDHGRESREILLRALAWYRALPDSQARLPRHRRHRAATLLRADSLHAAEAAFRALAAEFPSDPYYIASVAVSLARRGEREPASDILKTALTNDSPYDFGHHVYERARIAAELGDAADAINLMKQAFADGFRFAFVGGVGGTALSPDGRPHLDPAFDRLREQTGFQELARGRD